jgi:DNA polymerase-1
MTNHMILDFKYREAPSHVLQVLCCVAQHLESGRVWKQWLGGVESPSPAFPCDADTIVVAHTVAPAEARCLLELGWAFPGGWIDTYVEERVLARGMKPEEGFGLLECCRRRGIHVMADYQKEDMRALCLKEGEHDEAERQRILSYCGADVAANGSLFVEIRDRINIPQALLRGAYLAECSRITARGIPVDMARFSPLRELGNEGLRCLFANHFDDYGLLENGSLNSKRFQGLVDQSGITWPRTSAGAYATDKDTLREMAKLHGEPWRGVRQLLEVVRGASVDALVVNGNGRLIADARPFGTFTGRCTPSTSAFLWNGPKWLRFLLQPPPGRTVLVIDWSNQEFAIAAALSRDPEMIAAYMTGDPYMALAKQSGRVPSNATAETHPKERGQFKVVSLAVLMGMSAWGIGRRLETSESHGRELLDTHRRIYHRFWKWSDSTASTAAANRPLETAFGLIYQPGVTSKQRTARNFLLQATGSDMLRVAVLLLADKGLEVIATVHDSVMIECDTLNAAEVEKLAIQCMGEASRITLWDRLEVRTDVTRVDHPRHYQDKNGKAYWIRLAALLRLPLDTHEG